jgi:uncharacterized membrane protein
MPVHSAGILPYIIQGVFTLIFLALIVTLVLVLVKKYRHGKLHLPTFPAASPATETDPYLSALKLLNERLANGDLDVDDYYARRTALKGPDPTPGPTPEA